MTKVRWTYTSTSDAGNLQALGEEGWELVSVVIVEGKEKFYLKRPAPTLSEEWTLSQREAVLRGEDRC